MSAIERLLALADAREAEAKAFRLAAAALGPIATAAAAKALPGKLKQAARLRAEAPKPAPKRGALLAAVGEIFATTRHVREPALSAGIRARGFAGQGIGSLYRAGYLVVRKNGFVEMTAKGRVRVGVKSKPAKASTNGKGGSNAAYVAEVVKANGAPMSGAAIRAKAKADGRTLTGQAIGRASRDRLIVNAPREHGDKMFQAPA